MAETSSGATWADVGLALTAFAREDPLVFSGVLSLIAVSLWLLLPRATMILSMQTREKLDEKERQLRLPGTDEDAR